MKGREAGETGILTLCILMGALWGVLGLTVARGGTIFDEEWTLPEALRPQPGAAGLGTSSPRPPLNGQGAARQPIPDTAAQAQARKLLKTVFARNAADQSLAGRELLAQALIGRAQSMTGETVDKYVVLFAAYRACLEAGDLWTALRVIEQLERGFRIDGAAFRMDAAKRAARVRPIPGIAARGLRAVLRLVDSFAEAGDYTWASAVAAIWKSNADADPLIRSVLTRRARDLGSLETRQAAIARDFERLRVAPDDPALNESVGAFLCFAAGQWQRGLPMLARGSDQRIGEIARRELAGIGNTDRLADLGDAWWDAAVHQPAAAAAVIRAHAADIYRRAEWGLGGLRRDLVHRKISESTAQASHRLIDLLDLLDPANDAIVGTWELSRGWMTCDSNRPARIEFPYAPGAEYDMIVTFRRLRGRESVELICAGGGQQFVWGIGQFANRLSGIGSIEGRRSFNNETTKRANAWIVNDRSYTTIVHVRRDGVSTELNGATMVNWKGKLEVLSLHDWPLRHPNTVGIMCFDGAAVMESADLIDISGDGVSLRSP